MRYFITFGDEKYKTTRDFSARMAKFLGGFDRALIYSPEDIDEDFKNSHADIFNICRGYGLWLWKPYFIYKTLSEVCQEGDTLCYCDGGAFFIRNIMYIEKTMDTDDIWISHNSLVEWQFTKKDTFELMGCQGETYEKTAQAQGSFLYFRKTNNSITFVKEWLDLCCDIRLLHPENIYSKKENPIGFEAHREDQSVLSLLCKKRKIRLHQDPSQYGKYPEKYWQKGFVHATDVFDFEYPTCIILHRTPEVKLSIVIRQLILALVPRMIGLKMISYDASDASSIKRTE